MKPEEEPAREEEVSHDSDKSSPAGAVWLIIAGLLFAYPLSVGPVARIYDGRSDVPEVLKILYVPIGWLAERSPQARDFFDWDVMKVWGAHGH